MCCDLKQICIRTVTSIIFKEQPDIVFIECSGIAYWSPLDMLVFSPF
ncbi:GTP-binding protein [Staphylococcus aureus]